MIGCSYFASLGQLCWVRAAKLKGDENRLKVAIPFNRWSGSLTGLSQPLENAKFEDIPDNALIIPLTSDKGLCGGVNSFISRGIRTLVKTLDGSKKKCSVMIVGDKGRAQMRRFVPSQIVAAATEVVVPRNFMLASAVTSEILALGSE